MGRLFIAGESEPVVVLGHRSWQREFGGEVSVIGRTIELNDRPFTVIGVASAEFTSSLPLWNPSVFVPFSFARPILGVDPERWNGSVYVTAPPGAGRGPARGPGRDRRSNAAAGGESAGSGLDHEREAGCRARREWIRSWPYAVSDVTRGESVNRSARAPSISRAEREREQAE